MLRAAFYRGTRPGLQGLYSRLVRWWTRSPYSHCELVFSTGVAASASFIDNGVRYKRIDFNPAHWDFVELPEGLQGPALDWFCWHLGQPYDLPGNFHFVFALIGHDRRRWFCSEAVAAALGFIDPWRYSPGTLHSALCALRQPAFAGFSSSGAR